MATAEHNLDDIDRKIILELQEDARRQFSCYETGLCQIKYFGFQPGSNFKFI